ncbi:PLDc N-terminal domain-containing protein [Microbacterium sp. SS28]|uniref:PLDc N-terminal domain-containing protein n=1 Tax=Microbacterium sp. SS28 TaxID=2919948 RepID=UPI001FAB2EFD|nr:PLDc N-terminal domain-containing protein [Microbacterium sp. SS28]
MTHSQRELTAPEKIGAVVLGILQVAFAFLAAWDLAHRPAEQVRGPKPAWIPALFINWLGPAAYFVFGIRHEDR